MTKITINDPETLSVDVVAENVNHLKVLFPGAFTEGKVDFEVLKQLLGVEVDERDEKYGLNWHGKRRARQIALTPSTSAPGSRVATTWKEHYSTALITSNRIEPRRTFSTSCY